MSLRFKVSIFITFNSVILFCKDLLVIIYHLIFLSILHSDCNYITSILLYFDPKTITVANHDGIKISQSIKAYWRRSIYFPIIVKYTVISKFMFS